MRARPDGRRPPEKAVAAYQESLAAIRRFTEAMHGLARALQDLRRYDEAIVDSRERLAGDRSDDVLAAYQFVGVVSEEE